ncbi:MAG: hypothetical protein V4675_06645 [Verrucomicrobiota bacterium]
MYPLNRLRSAAVLLTLPALGLCFNHASAATLLTESFDYSAGALIEDNGWLLNSGTTIKQTATSPGLTYAGMDTAGLSTQLTQVSSGTSGQDLAHSFTAQSSGTLYTSFLISLSGGPITSTVGDYPIHMQQISAGPFFNRVVIRTDGLGGFNFGLRKESSGTIAYESNARAYSTTYLVVMSYEFVDGGTSNDIGSLWVNPTLTALPPVALLTTTSGVDATGLDRVNLRQSSSTGFAHTDTVDEIKVTTTWAEAIVGVPEPSTSLLGLVAGLGLMRRRR